MCPLPFFLPFLAVISFRKKKENEESKDDLAKLPSLDQKGVLPRQPGDQASDANAQAQPKDDERIKVVNATVTDLKGQVDGLQMQGKSLKGDIDSMKNDLGSINESMKALLQVYEMVSRQYNPFVENSFRNNDMEQMSIPMKKPSDDQPDDFIMRPQDSFEAVPLGQARPRAPEFDPFERPNADRKMQNGRQADAAPEQRQQHRESPPPAIPYGPAAPAPSYKTDNYCFTQVHKIVEYHMNRIYMEKMNGSRLAEEDYDELDHWLAELRRLEVR
ncbi:MAG: flagella accessory protein C [Methanomassiliicoccales archaeon]|jgi:hypothetical protein